MNWKISQTNFKNLLKLLFMKPRDKHPERVLELSTMTLSKFSFWKYVTKMGKEVERGRGRKRNINRNDKLSRKDEKKWTKEGEQKRKDGRDKERKRGRSEGLGKK